MAREFSRIFGVCAITGLLTVVFATAAAAKPSKRPCSLKTIVGSWVFASEVGEFTDVVTGEPLGKGTAMGTWNVDKEGNMTGKFDLNCACGEPFVLQGVDYWGPVTVYPDCRGTVSFETSMGDTRTDSIVISESGDEIRGMSLTEGTLWTYTLKRTGKGR